MDGETSVLPTSSRPPPAGQDAVEFKEGEFKGTACQGAKDTCYEVGKAFKGTPLNLSCQNPLEISSQKMAHVQQNYPVVEAYASAAVRNNNVCSQYFYENWRNSFESLVYDAEGRRVFYSYLTQENHAVLLECLGACETFRTLPPTNDLYISARDFYKRFIQFRNPKLQIRDSTRTKVNQWMRNSSLHSLMFEEVERDVFSALRSTWYDRFISSDFFLNYCLSANQKPERRESKALQSTTKRLCMPVVEEESTGDFREKDGAHGKEIKGKSMKFSDELRRTAQDPTVPCQLMDQPKLAAKSEADLGDLEAVNKEPRSKLGSVMSSDLMSGKRERQRNKEHEDNLPTLPHFKPRTERINREAMKPMKPEDFARILCEKLEKVIHDREFAEKGAREVPLPLAEESEKSAKQITVSSTRTASSLPLTSGEEPVTAKGSCQSHNSYPQSDRYSVAGMSSASGSEVKSDSQLKYRHGAKELASAVHHALRTELKECDCQQCLEKHLTLRKHDNPLHSTSRQDVPVSQIAHCQCCKLLQNQHEPLLHQRVGPHGKLTTSNLQTLKGPQANVDHQRIYSWIEHNEKYKSEMVHPHVIESPHQTPTTKRRHRQPVVYDTSRPTVCAPGCMDHVFSRDQNIPLVPQPDTNLVLEEAKRRLEDNSRGMSKSSRRSGRSSSRPPYMEPVYAETAPSTTSDNWTLSDSASSVSRNQVPSVISSSIPSSASQYINESNSNIHCESVRSHSSGGSRGHSDKTIVTYFLGLEPIPYRTSLPGKNITLAQFRALITKKGIFRYFFKTKTKDDGIVYQQVENDDEYLPKFENKIVVKMEKVE